MASAKMVAIVSKIPSPKDWADRRTGRNIKLYSFQVNGDSRWFRLGATVPNFNVGDNVSFEYDPEKNQVDADTVQVLAAPTGPSRGAPIANVTGGKDEYWAKREAKDDQRQARIEYQSARKDAISLLPTLLANGAVPGITEKTAAAKRLDILLGVVEELTVTLLNQGTDTNEEPEAATEEVYEDE